MSNYSDVFAGMKTVLETNIPGLKSFAHPPENVNHFPSAVLLPEPFDPTVAFGGNSFDGDVRVVVFVSSGDSAEGWAQLLDMMDPTTANVSIIKALRTDATLDGKVDSSQITRVENQGRRQVGGGFYYAFDVLVNFVKKVA